MDSKMEREITDGETRTAAILLGLALPVKGILGRSLRSPRGFLNYLAPSSMLPPAWSLEFLGLESLDG